MIIGLTQNLKKKVRDFPVTLNWEKVPTTDYFECLEVIIDKRLLWDKTLKKYTKE